MAGRLGGGDAVLGRGQGGGLRPRGGLALLVRTQCEVAAGSHRECDDQKCRADAGQPATAQTRALRHSLGDDRLCRSLRRITGLGFVSGRVIVDRGGLIHRLLDRTEFGVVVGGRGRVQPAGASISFHPSSPVLLEVVTLYFTPSGPTNCPLCGL